MKLPTPVVEKVSLKKLKPWLKNPRKDHDIDTIAKSYESFGSGAPIIVQKGTYRILAGHGRLKALQKLGAAQTHVWVMDIDDQKADQYTLIDNKATENTAWDFEGLSEIIKGLQENNVDVSALGWSDFELEPLLSADWKPSEEEPLDDMDDARNAKPIFVTPAQRIVINRAVEIVRRMEEDPEITEGRALELISADFLAGK